MARDTRVKITKGDAVGLVLEESVSVWERNGWTRADDGSSTDATIEPESVTAEVGPMEASAKKTTTRKAQ